MKTPEEWADEIAMSAFNSGKAIENKVEQIRNEFKSEIIKILYKKQEISLAYGRKIIFAEDFEKDINSI